MSLICSKQNDYETALEFAQKSLIYNSHNFNALNLKTILLKALDKDYKSHARYTLSLDNLDIISMYLLDEDISKHIINSNMLIDLSIEFAFAGFYDDAIKCFEQSIGLGCDFATPYRNLSLLYYNVMNDADKALKLLETAYSMDETDARVLYELDLLKKRIGVSPNERLEFLNQHLNIVNTRDDLYLEYITLLNLTEQYDKALNHIMAHKFHPWEGGEGKVPEQYLFSNIALALEKQDINYLLSTFEYPHNLGEGKLYGAQENRQNYYLGCAYENQGEFDLAKDCFIKASSGISEPASAMYIIMTSRLKLFFIREWHCLSLVMLKMQIIASIN